MIIAAMRMKRAIPVAGSVLRPGSRLPCAPMGRRDSLLGLILRGLVSCYSGLQPLTHVRCRIFRPGVMFQPLVIAVDQIP